MTAYIKMLKSRKFSLAADWSDVIQRHCLWIEYDVGQSICCTQKLNSPRSFFRIGVPITHLSPFPSLPLHVGPTFLFSILYHRVPRTTHCSKTLWRFLLTCVPSLFPSRHVIFFHSGVASEANWWNYSACQKKVSPKSWSASIDSPAK